MGYPHGRKTNGAGKLGLGNVQFVQNLFQEFTRMNRGQIVFRIHDFNSLMIIGYFDIASLAVFKPETDAPLIVDANAPLPGAISAQRFQAVGWRHAEVIKRHGRVQLGQSLASPPQHVGREVFRSPGRKKTFGLSIRESSDHENDHKQVVYNSQADFVLLSAHGPPAADFIHAWANSRIQASLRLTTFSAFLRS
jgi:hypothetical protein